MAEYVDGRWISSRDALSSIAMGFIDEFFSVRSMNHILPYLLRSLEDDDDVRDIGKYDSGSVLLHSTLPNANLVKQ